MTIGEPRHVESPGRLAWRPVPPVRSVVDRRRFLVEVSRGMKVVHLGCVDEHFTAERAGTGDLLHQEVSRVADELVGVDISRDGLDLLASIVPGKYIFGNVEHLSDLDLPETTDVVLAAELIEHVDNPGLFLRSLASYLRTTGAVAFITTPNCFSWRNASVFAVTGVERTHPDHRTYYSPLTLTQALEAAGLEIVELRAHTWLSDGSRIARFLDGIILRFNPLLAIGLIVKVRATDGRPTT